MLYFHIYILFYYWKKVLCCSWYNLKVISQLDKYSLRELGAFWRQAIFGESIKIQESVSESITLPAGVIDGRRKITISHVYVSNFKIQQTHEIEKNAGDKQNLAVSAISKYDIFKIMHPRALEIVSFCSIKICLVRTWLFGPFNGEFVLLFTCMYWRQGLFVIVTIF